MGEQIQDIWKRFDEVINKAGTSEARTIAEALKLHAELLNMKLGALEQAVNIGLKQTVGK